MTAQRSLRRLGCFRVLVRAARRPVHRLPSAAACLGPALHGQTTKSSNPHGESQVKQLLVTEIMEEVAAQELPRGGGLWSNRSATASLLHPCGLPMGSWVRYPCAVLRRTADATRASMRWSRRNDDNGGAVAAEATEQSKFQLDLLLIIH